MGSIKK
jgi:hypothetical protein